MRAKKKKRTRCQFRHQHGSTNWLRPRNSETVHNKKNNIGYDHTQFVTKRIAFFRTREDTPHTANIKTCTSTFACTHSDEHQDLEAHTSTNVRTRTHVHRHISRPSYTSTRKQKRTQNARTLIHTHFLLACADTSRDVKVRSDTSPSRSRTLTSVYARHTRSSVHRVTVAHVHAHKETCSRDHVNVFAYIRTLRTKAHTNTWTQDPP